MSDGMDEIIEDFVTEAEESLEKIDPLFVELEKGYDREILNDIFRSMHTIKGAAGFLGFQSIVDVAHVAEALLKKLREGELGISTDLISVILKSMDMLKLLQMHIKEKDEVEEDISGIIAELNAALGGQAASAEEDAPLPEFNAPPVPGADEAEEPAMAEDEGYTVEEVVPVIPEPAAVDESTKQSLINELFGDLADEDDHDDDANLVSEGAFPDRSAYEEIPVAEEFVPEEISPEAASGAIPPEIAAALEAAKRATDGIADRMQGGKSATARQQQAPPSGQAQSRQAAKGGGGGGLQTLRVDVDRIDKVMNLTGEIVLVRNRLLNISTALDIKHTGDEHVDGLAEAVSFLDLVTSDIQLAVMKMRMQPIKKVFGKFPRLVRDISQNLGKDVQLDISGEDTEVDRSVIERIGDPLVHTLRNAIDHGIESLEDRRAKGKPPKGLVEVKAYQQGSQIVIEVTDDGRGLDVEKIKNKALRQGIVSAEEALKMSEKEAINLIFMPGFTTMEKATELSGRGVGMDVVKTNISRLNGYVEILTTKDVGTTLRISIPLTLAIIQALMVRSGGSQYAIPLGPIEETLKVSSVQINHVSGSPVLAIRDRVYPVADLSEVLTQTRTEAFERHGQEHRYVLVIAVGDRNFCVAVDELIGQEEVVIKAIDGIDTDSTGILGATITGEGKIVLILDPSGMSRIISELAD